ncbi:alpha/beta fold hydrolase [Phreatobacter stygius]|nr:alpha/beta hydrolase [Phreatobacter stygius]
MTMETKAASPNILDLFAAAFTEIRAIRNSEMVEMTDDMRRSAKASTVSLSRGALHYELVGPDDGPVAVLLSGATLPMWVWDPVMAPLAAVGFRVLRFNYYGRGCSDCPFDPQDPAFFNAQITELTEALALRPPFHIVSIAFGALVGLLYAEQAPARVASLTLIAPDGMGTNVSPGLGLTLTPGLGDYLFDLVGNDLLLQRMPTYSDDRAVVADLTRRISECFAVKGYKRSVLSSIREMPIHTAEASYRAVAANRTRTLVLWGRRDGTTPVAIMDRIRPVMPDAEYRVLEAAHLPPYEDPDLFLSALLPFLRSAVG